MSTRMYARQPATKSATASSPANAAPRQIGQETAAGPTETTRRPERAARAEHLGHHLSRFPVTAARPAANGPGRPLPEPMRERMETSFGHDFSAVRIHEGPQAEGLGAIAYTQGQDIHFAPGKYRPSTHEGRQLIGHELTHVVQQRAGRVAVPQGKGAPINSDPHLEDEADHAGAKAARGEQVAVQGARRPGAAITAVGTQRPQPPRAPGRLTHSTGAAAAPFQLQPDDKKKGDPKFYIQPPKVGGQALKKEIERMHKSGAYSHPDQIYANLRSEGYESAEIMHHLKDLK